MVLPPKPVRFERNRQYDLRRGFASKVPAELARDRFNLTPTEKVVWLSPDGNRILTTQEASLHNARRRSSLNIRDAWKDLKSISPDKAQDLGWNGFQRLTRGLQGSRVGILKRLQTVGIDLETLDELAQASEGQPGENNGWGDSG